MISPDSKCFVCKEAVGSGEAAHYRLRAGREVVTHPTDSCTVEMGKHGAILMTKSQRLATEADRQFLVKCQAKSAAQAARG